MRFFLAALVLSGAAQAGQTTYDLSRVIDARYQGAGFEQDPYLFSGVAVTHDTGPFTPMEALQVEVSYCEAGLFSPAPDCEPYRLQIDEQVDGWVDGGRAYFLEDGTPLTILRRGQTGTGANDPSLILVHDGLVLVFREAPK